MNSIYSSQCTNTIGCKYHRKWDRGFVRTFGHSIPGFTEIDSKNSDTLYGSDNDMNTRAKQYLCFIANHEILNRIMKRKSYIVKKLEELNENEIKTSIFTKCYGLNVGMGTEKIGIRLRNNGKFVSYNTIIDTMIHELAHMDEPNHGDNFYKKQKELRDIYDTFEKINWSHNYFGFNFGNDILYCIIFVIILLVLYLLRLNKFLYL